MNINSKVKSAHEKAALSMKNSHAPYSKLHVCSAISLKGAGEVVIGVNVENASFGATICAERSAIVSAQSQFGKFVIDFVVVISDMGGEPIPPCGMCLQVLSEFAHPDTPIYLGSEKEILKSHQLKDFLPLSFSKEMLPR